LPRVELAAVFPAGRSSGHPGQPLDLSDDGFDEFRIVASAILADVEPGASRPAEKAVIPVKRERSRENERSFPGGKMPPSTAGGTPAATFSDTL